ncbi:hypothetical protein [Prochlorococcus marinus]|uniref:Uncharacterized protein n=1 Tax=Prochlorococcus marinus XMU1408 TaxID=2213228 RepID=A0A318R5P3_PROMR|nr:hypothetical protein [Prochlorococcus marinus]MBW3041089.1 hypothetical protein [Prochlorococcus marinus str. XMU1408]PYE03693.1 hypothetical protein DNJ73_00450 [Prochlorococcus marinus XMU1408]
MYLKSLDECQLKIGSYPKFSYNAVGGGGKATLVPTKKTNNKRYVSFSSETFSIPPLTSQTTKFLSLPLPPGIKISMSMDKLEGSVDNNSGEVLLEFESKFVLSIGSVIKFPDLLVKTLLQTGQVKGQLHQGKGLSLQKNGKTKLVGIAIIPPTGNKFLDTFLGLPNEALAELQCEIQ